MKSFKDIVKETVAEPKGEDEKRFKKQHTDNVRVFDYGSKTSERATKKYARKIPRLADYQKGEDQAAYDQAYAEEVSLEEEMTDAQKKKREEIVKELKKKKDEFKDNYGDDWKDVMYATATKMAMKEDVEKDSFDLRGGSAKRRTDFDRSSEYSSQMLQKAIRRKEEKASSFKRGDKVVVDVRKQTPFVRYNKDGDIKRTSIFPKEGFVRGTVVRSTGQGLVKVKLDKPVSYRETIKGKRKTIKMTESDFPARSIKKIDDVRESLDNDHLSEDPWEEVPMMERQLEFICYAAEEIKSYVTMGVDPEEWFQNKLAHVHGQMRTLHAYIEGDKRIRNAKTMDPFHMGEQNDLNEEVIDDLKKILKDKSMDEVTLSNGDKLDVDVQTANVLLKIYDALSSQHKKKFADALNKNEKMFMKMLDFAYSKVK